MWLFYICCLHSVFTLGPQQTQWGASKKYSREVNQLQILKGEMRTDRQTFICLEFMENVMWLFFFSVCVFGFYPVTSSSRCVYFDVLKVTLTGQLHKVQWSGWANWFGRLQQRPLAQFDTSSLVWAWHSKYNCDDFCPRVYCKISHFHSQFD